MQVHREAWYREANETELARLLHLRRRGEDVDRELIQIASRLGFPDTIPQAVYRDLYDKHPWQQATHDVMDALPGIFQKAFPNFTQELWRAVGDYDPRHLAEFFENDDTLQHNMEIAWQMEDDFEVEEGYRVGFFDAVDYVQRVMAPAMSNLMSQLQGSGYVTPNVMSEMEQALEEWEGPRQVLETQMSAAQLRSEYLPYALIAQKLEWELGPAAALAEEAGEFPEKAELTQWLNEAEVLTYNLGVYRGGTAHQLKRLKEMGQEWEEKWEPVLDRLQEETGLWRYDLYERYT